MFLLNPYRFAAAWSPASLFAAGELGAWYDPSDLSSMFEDAAGTVPVTGVERPVGLLLDKSGRANHLSQSNAASRPVLRARYNLITQSENFGDGLWSKTGVTVTINTHVAPDGTTTGDTITHAAQSGEIIQNFLFTPNSYQYSFYAKYVDVRWIRPVVGSSLSNVFVWFDIQNGQVGQNGTAGTSTLVSANIVSVGNGWYRCFITANITAAASTYAQINTAVADGDHTRAAGSFAAWGAQLMPVVQASGLNNRYQRVGVAADYNSVGFEPYIDFDGTDDCLFSASAVALTATDQMTVHAGITRLSNISTSILAETGTDATLTNASWHIVAPASALDNYAFRARGTSTSAAVTPSNYPAPSTVVITGTTDISDDYNEIRVNGTSQNTNANNLGAGSFGNLQLFVGARNNASNRLRMRFYSLVVRNKLSTAQEIADAEAYINARTKAY